VAGAIKHFELAVGTEDLLAYSEPPFWYYPTRQSLGVILLQGGDLYRAEEVLRASLPRTPNNGWALFALSEVYKRHGDKRARRPSSSCWTKLGLGIQGR
jgi:hypothetical protein